MEEGMHINAFLEFQEDALIHLNALFEFHDEAIKGLEEEYRSNLKKLNEVLFGVSDGHDKINTENKTPQQTKKRSKRLTALDEKENEDNTTQNEDISESETKSTRPMRAAKMNLNLKEKNIGQKIRRPSNFDPNHSTNIYVKQEKKDDAPTKPGRHNKTKTMQMEIDECEKFTTSDSSILFVNKQASLVEIDSDADVEGDKMPPPLAPAPRKRGPKKKSGEIDLPKIIKTEKISIGSDDTTTTSKTEDKDSKTSSQKSTEKKGKKNKQIPKPIIIKEEVEELSQKEMELPETNKKLSNQKERKQSHKSNRGESFESVYEDAVAPQSENLKTADEEINLQTDFVNNTVNGNDITKSVTDQLATLKTPILNTTKPKLTDEKMSDKAEDSTFVSAKSIPALAHNIAVAMADATFVKDHSVLNQNQATFLVGEKERFDSTENVQQGNTLKMVNCDQTFEVKVNPSNNPEETYVRDSIMTEDNSHSEEIPESEEEDFKKIKYKPKPKCKMNKNQIFNPFVQSPLKTKVQAFERVAADMAEQNQPQRTTRTKTRAKQQNYEDVEIENKPITNLKESTKTTTPILGRHLGRILTPTQSTTSFTPTLGASVKKMPNSASKAIGLTKALTSVGKLTSSTQSRSRENSSEDLKRGYIKFQQLAAERKKKREEKQQQASNIREQKEKERADRLKKLMEEREEKLRIADQKRQVEEIQKNLKLLEEKNEQKRKLEKQKLLEKQAAAVAKKEREMLENLKIQKAKEQMQLKYLKNQKLQQTKIKENVIQFNFEMLQTDDETDDEDTISKKRPPLPEWSLKETRKVLLDNQAYMPTQLIDNFFSVQPLTPDLREIFPAIDSRYCKRNSSVYWNTPPRYSQLPKY